MQFMRDTLAKRVFLRQRTRLVVVSLDLWSVFRTESKRGGKDGRASGIRAAGEKLIPFLLIAVPTRCSQRERDSSSVSRCVTRAYQVRTYAPLESARIAKG